MKTCFWGTTNEKEFTLPVPKLFLMQPLNTYLSETQISVLHVAVNRIIPADDFPGGWDAGVGDFYSLLFAREPQFLPAYRQGLDRIDAEVFLSADAAAQDDLLARSEGSFLDLLVSQTMEGFYADPGNGGNKDCISWKMIGYEVTA